MAEKSSIEWTDATWNPITGCSVVSPGCTNCYAMRLAGTRLRDHPTRQGLTVATKAGPVWNGQVRLNERMLADPLRWRRPRRIFVCAHGDLFHESVPDAWIDQVVSVMAAASHHTFQVLTKRPERMRAYFRGAYRPRRPWPWPLPNVWLGVSAEDQRRAAERIPDLLMTPAAVHFLSAEPLLGPLDLRNVWPDHTATMDALTGQAQHLLGMTAKAAQLAWVIVGGESGPGARPMHPQWARQIRDDCAAAGVPFLFKQWGAWALSSEAEAGSNPHAGWLSPQGHHQVARTGDLYPENGAAFLVNVGKKAAGRVLDGCTHDAMPRGAE